MSINKIEIQDGSGNVYYPKTSIDYVIYSDNTSIEEKIIILERKLIELKSQLANSINNKTGSSLTSNSTVDEMTAIINSIKTLEQATADANATASNILVDKTAYVNGTKVTGTMPNIGHQTATINAGGRVTISKGYHDGTGYIQANTMAKQMQDLGVTLTSTNQLIKDIKAVDKNGNLITGTATIESLGGVPFHKTVGKAHFEVTSGSYHMFHPQINFDYDILEGYWYHTDMGDTNDSRHYFYINKRYWSTSDMYLLNALPYGKSKTNVDDNNPPSGSTSGKPGIWRRYCSNTTNINTYQLLNNPQISTFTYSSNPNLDITVISFAYKI